MFAVSSVAGGVSMGLNDPAVNLQATTPGVQQTGNANISGRIVAGSLQAADSSPTAQVIVGNATSTTGANFGGFFRSDSVMGRALYGRASAATGTTHGVWGQSDSSNGRGVTGVAPSVIGAATGVWGQAASSTGRGVYGLATEGGGVNYGVLGQSNSSRGFGVFSIGNMHATGVISGNGSGLTQVDALMLGGFPASSYLKGIPNPLVLTGNDPTAVIRASTTSIVDGSSAVYGRSDGSNKAVYGVLGESHTKGAGVLGRSFPSTGDTAAVVGHCYSTEGSGVYGWALATEGNPVGVEGLTFGGRGVLGRATRQTGTTYGVYGAAGSPDGFGVFALGALGASGTKSFRIDHPLDPENKYLLHYATESPMPQNFYVGNVVTDADGYAWVTLPDYFSEINKNFKYQLTIVGKTFAQAVVWEKIKGNRFQIRTNAPNIEVSWRVDADRNDVYVRNRPPQDVVAKQAPEKGRYQHPQFYGFGPDRGIDADREARNHQAPPVAEQRKR